MLSPSSILAAGEVLPVKVAGPTRYSGSSVAMFFAIELEPAGNAYGPLPPPFDLGGLGAPGNYDLLGLFASQPHIHVVPVPAILTLTPHPFGLPLVEADIGLPLRDAAWQNRRLLVQCVTLDAAANTLGAVWSDARAYCLGSAGGAAMHPTAQVHSHMHDPSQPPTSGSVDQNVCVLKLSFN